ncbi:copper ion binding protein [Mariniphaga anaerophila]|uniref:Copper ion binding protein n=1 Tax=Mariniphaga anaerophila TaxID=1484053 RepID=A0A1M5AF96_9BACT|nr:heavy metal-associated domain-containing protein [Mariniphaga anaerophila]SHF28804.1 copper ion binding protein [Mariniphaga anaerophila]
MRTLISILMILFVVSCGQGTKKKAEQGDSPQIILAEVKMHVGGMHCEMCVASIEKGVGSVEGVDSVKVALNDSSLVVLFNTDETSLDEIKQAVEKRGYTVKE